MEIFEFTQSELEFIGYAKERFRRKIKRQSNNAVVIEKCKDEYIDDLATRDMWNDKGVGYNVQDLLVDLALNHIVHKNVMKNQAADIRIYLLLNKNSAALKREILANRNDY